MALSIAAEPAPLAVDPDGVVRVGGTRVTLDAVVTAFQEGASAEEIALRYPALGLADVYGAIGYSLRRRSDVEAYLDEQRRLAEATRADLESRYDPSALRPRLL